jgi:hypothetical protein
MSIAMSERYKVNIKIILSIIELQTKLGQDLMNCEDWNKGTSREAFIKNLTTIITACETLIQMMESDE